MDLKDGLTLEAAVAAYMGIYSAGRGADMGQKIAHENAIKTTVMLVQESTIHRRKSPPVIWHMGKRKGARPR